MSDIIVNFDPVFRALDRLGNVLQQDIREVDAQVGTVRRDLQTTQADLNRLRDRLEEYIE